MSANRKDDSPKGAKHLSADMRAFMVEAARDRREAAKDRHLIAGILDANTTLLERIVRSLDRHELLLDRILRTLRIQGNGHPAS